MRTKSLYGVQVAQNEQARRDILEHFISWKNKKIAAFEKEQENLTASMRELFGGSAEGARQQSSTDAPLKQPEPDYREAEDLLLPAGYHQYYITAPVLTMCEKIRVKEPYDVEWLAPIKDGRRQLNFGNSFIRYKKDGNRIVAVSVTCTALVTGSPYLQYSFFNMDLGSRHLSGQQSPDDYDPTTPVKLTHQEYDTASKKLFFQLLTFMELASIEEVMVPPGRKHGTKKSDGNLLNESNFPITIVSTNWNKIIRTDGFAVDGHLRKQAYGPGYKLRRLIWIDAFHKNGYNLNAKKMQEIKRNGPHL